MRQKDIVLVTGATGFIGLRLVRALLKRGNTQIRCLVRNNGNTDPLGNVCNEFPGAEIDVVQGDLKSGDGLEEAVQDIQAIYHLAAMKNGPLAASYANTVVGTRNLLEAVKNSTSLRRFVHVSSFAVYGTAKLRKGSRVNEDTPLEDDLLKRNDGYTYIKIKQEQKVWEYAKKFQIPVVVLRPGVVYGPGGDTFSKRVGFKLFGCFINVGRNNLLPLTYVDNCVDALIAAGSKDGAVGKVFNVVDDQLLTCNQYLSLYKKNVEKLKTLPCPYLTFLSVSWLYDKYYKFSNGQLPPIFNAYKTASIWKGQTFENQRIKDALGWVQSVPTNIGMERTFRSLGTNLGSNIERKRS